MADIDVAVMEAWWRVKPVLLSDPEELARRLARRRTALIMRPPRAYCLGVRASDRRMTAWETAMVPEKLAMGRGEEGYGEHVVYLNARVVKRLCAEVDLDIRAYEGSEVAEKLGVSTAQLNYGMRKGKYRVARIFGLSGKKVNVPLVWKEDGRSCDPGAGNCFSPPEAVWGSGWKFLAAGFPEEFEQGVSRVPVYRRYRYEEKRFRGWRWICPGCKRKVRTIYFPRPVMTMTEFLGDEKLIVKNEADALPRANECFACSKCHGIRYWTSLTHSAWNHLVAYLWGGVLLGGEVEGRGWVVKKRKRKYAAHAAKMVRGELVAGMLVEGKSYGEMASEMGISINTVQGHVRRVYAKYGVGSRGELGEVRSRNEE